MEPSYSAEGIVGEHLSLVGLKNCVQTCSAAFTLTVWQSKSRSAVESLQSCGQGQNEKLTAQTGKPSVQNGNLSAQIWQSSRPGKLS